MTNFKNLDGTPENQQKEELLGSLFQHASSRPRAPADDEAAIRAATHLEWQKVAGKRKHQRYLAVFGLAASLVLTVIVVINLRQPAANFEHLANLDVQSGEIFVHNMEDGHSTAHRLTVDKLYAGQVITTNSGARLALNWKTGESVRMDENSRLSLISESEIELIEGRVYVDTGLLVQAGSSFVIRTIAGPIHHTGTQYLAGIDARTVTLAVREGEVLLRTGIAEVMVHKGELVRFEPSGKTKLSTVPTFGKMWEWASLVTPALNLDGLSAFEFVHWAGRETGREVEFFDLATQELSMETQLRGSVNLSPDKALDLILLTSDIEAVTGDGKILIRRRPAN